MQSYLRATGRTAVATAADQAASQGFLRADEGAEYDEVIEIVGFRIGVPVLIVLKQAQTEPL